MDLNNTIDQMKLTDIFRTFLSPAAGYIFFSGTVKTFSRIYSVVCHKTTLNRLKKIKIIPSILSDHNGMKQKET